MEYNYKKSISGYHFYRIGDNVLHVFHTDNDDTIVQETEFLTQISEIKKDDCCINIIDNIPEKTKPSSKEEFEKKLRQVILILGIYDYCQPEK